MSTFIRVDPKGSYLQPTDALAASPPTEISFVKYGIRPGDYLGLRCVGEWVPGQGFEPANGLVACFFGFGVGGPVRPGKFGQEALAVTQPTWPLQLPTDIPQDFAVTPERTWIVRAPEGATRLLFSVTDSYMGDNFDTEGNFGVEFTMPNRSVASPGRVAEAAAKTEAIDEPEAYDQAQIDSLRSALGARVERQWPEATSFAASQVAVEASEATRAQLRGWYLNSGWNPANSRYNPTGTGSRKHGGVDIFTPRGTKLIAPVGPCWVEWLPNVKGFGNTVAFRFKKDGKQYSAIYAHCDEFLLEGASEVAAGQVVATAGCTGNAAAENCGIDFEHGGRSDHVHLGLYEGEVIGGDGGVSVDPLTLFAWSPLVPD